MNRRQRLWLGIGLLVAGVLVRLSMSGDAATGILGVAVAFVGLVLVASTWSDWRGRNAETARHSEE